MRIVERKVWVTILTCKCGRSDEMWHYGTENRPTDVSYPSCGEWNGWDLIEEKCPSCPSTKIRRRL